MSFDGCEWEVPDTPDNAAAFGRRTGGGPGRSAYPKLRLVTLTECGTYACVGAAIGPVEGSEGAERVLVRSLYPRLEDDQLLLADRGFYSFTDWCQAADTGAQLLWRVTVNLELPVLRTLPDGSYLSVVLDTSIKGTSRARLIATARNRGPLDPRQARLVRVIEYEVANRKSDAEREVICLTITLLEHGAAPAAQLAAAYHQRWEHEEAFAQIKTYLRGPDRILRSRSPQMVRQEIYGYLLTHYALTTLISDAATAADIDPDRVSFTRTVRVVRREIAARPTTFPLTSNNASSTGYGTTSPSRATSTRPADTAGGGQDAFGAGDDGLQGGVHVGVRRRVDLPDIGAGLQVVP